jgi:adenine-specific DNA-methyltransferase
LALLAEIEASFPSLEDSGAKVGIGVATGADKVFLVSDNHGVEPDRLLPLALPRDIASGSVKHAGTMLVNPWDSNGLVELDSWPGMANYLSQHRTTLAKRHTAKKGKWHRTIDRVIDGLAKKPKLYLPDFKERTFPVLDNGSTYPHHNLYWITSERWDLTVLGGLLLSDVANLFMTAYSVKMRGGFLRFQAQYLRRIRVPHPDTIADSTASALSEAFQRRDTSAATDIALQLYGLPALPD